MRLASVQLAEASKRPLQESQIDHIAPNLLIAQIRFAGAFQDEALNLRDSPVANPLKHRKLKRPWAGVNLSRGACLSCIQTPAANGVRGTLVDGNWKPLVSGLLVRSRRIIPAALSNHVIHIAPHRAEVGTISSKCSERDLFQLSLPFARLMAWRSLPLKIAQCRSIMHVLCVDDQSPGDQP